MTIQEILEAHTFAHSLLTVRGSCNGCDWKDYAGPIPSAKAHRAHVAEVLDKHMQDSLAQGLDTAAIECNEIYNQPQPNYYAPGHVIRALHARAKQIREQSK